VSALELPAVKVFRRWIKAVAPRHRPKLRVHSHLAEVGRVAQIGAKAPRQQE
jgi:hypothetical protein